MTTGRINQVTIVAPVKACRPCFRAVEFTRLLGGGHASPRGVAAQTPEAVFATSLIHFPLLNSPELCRQEGYSASAPYHTAWEPQEEALPRGSANASPSSWYPQ
jgi:hypothetical protein